MGRRRRFLTVILFLLVIALGGVVRVRVADGGTGPPATMLFSTMLRVHNALTVYLYGDTASCDFPILYGTRLQPYLHGCGDQFVKELKLP